VVISAVTRHSAGAGLRRGDVIETINGKRVRDGANLLVILAKKEVGDKVEVGVRRAGEPLEVEVELVKQNEIR
jgi:S1-C subfamily serine protease